MMNVREEVTEGTKVEKIPPRWRGKAEKIGELLKFDGYMAQS